MEALSYGDFGTGLLGDTGFKFDTLGLPSGPMEIFRLRSANSASLATYLAGIFE